MLLISVFSGVDCFAGLVLSGVCLGAWFLLCGVLVCLCWGFLLWFWLVCFSVGCVVCWCRLHGCLGYMTWLLFSCYCLFCWFCDLVDGGWYCC